MFSVGQSQSSRERLEKDLSRIFLLLWSHFRFRRTLSVSVPNICLSCDEERKSSAKNVKNLKDQRIIEDLEDEDEKIEDVNTEHQLTE